MVQGRFVFIDAKLFGSYLQLLVKQLIGFIYTYFAQNYVVVAALVVPAAGDGFIAWVPKLMSTIYIYLKQSKKNTAIGYSYKTEEQSKVVIIRLL